MDEPVPASCPIQLHIGLRPAQIGLRKIDRIHLHSTTRRRIDGKRTGIAEQVEHPLTPCFIPDHPPRDPVIQEKTRVQVIGEVDAESETSLFCNKELLFTGQLFIP